LEDFLQAEKYNFDTSAGDQSQSVKRLAAFGFFRATLLETPGQFNLQTSGEWYLLKEKGVPVKPAKWHFGPDYAFLEIQENSNRFLLPSVEIPKDDADIALVGYVLRFAGDESEHFTSYGLPVAPDASGFSKLFGMNRKFISAGDLCPDAWTEQSVGHVANSEKSSSGGPIMLAKAVPFPQFLGIHVGAFPGPVAWNHAVHTQHKQFRVDWFIHVFPNLKTIWATLSPPQKEHIKRYLTTVEEVYPELHKSDVDAAIKSLQ